MSDNKEKALQLKKRHIEWKKQNRENRAGFFPVFYGFKDYLTELSSGAVALFIYIGLHSNNHTGECYHDVSTIAKHFKKSPRTITSWFKELEDNGLISRLQLTFNGVAHTYIHPYGEREGVNNGDKG